MRIAGMGYRRAAGLGSLEAALAEAGGSAGLDALATLAGKEGPPLADLAAELGVPVFVFPRERLEGVETQTRSGLIEDRFATGSVAEAAALLACGEGARLVVARKISADGMATAAIAESGEAS